MPDWRKENAMRLLKLLLVIFVCAAGPAVGGCTATDGAAVPKSVEGGAGGSRVAETGNDWFVAYQRGDYATAFRLLSPLAEQGNAKDQNSLGVMYRKGQGVTQDYATAASWFRKAADQGHANAQHELGTMYYDGQGVPRDYATAASWIRKAADQGDAGAQANLGTMYYNGQGVTKDNTSAVYWYRKAANQGQAYAQKSLQEMLAEVPPAATVPLPQRSTPAEAPLPQQSTIAAAPVPQRSVSGSSIQMKREGGTYVVPVLINNAITLDFTVDSGASDVSIPEDVVSTLIRAGTIKSTDFIDEQTYTLADGSKMKSHTFRIRSLKVGDRVLENVTGSVAPAKGSLLLGQSFLGRFKSWSIDNGKHVLVLE